MSRDYEELVALEPVAEPWERVFTVAPLVLVGTREEDGGYDLAPKHMATPVGLAEFFGFVCTPRHMTYHNARREEAFTVTYPRPTQVVLASLAAAPRCDDRSKPAMKVLPTFRSRRVDGVFAADGRLFLECELTRLIDGFDDYSLLIGRIVAAYAHRDTLRVSDRDDAELVHESPLLAYVHPGRFARVRNTNAFPLPVGFED